MHQTSPHIFTNQNTNSFPRMPTTYSFFLFLILITTTLSSPTTTTTATGGGQWTLLQKNIGIVAMHMQLLHTDTVLIFDRTDFGLSNLSLPNGICRHDPSEMAAKTDCTAHSIEYDVASNTFRALFIQTNVWCSSASVSADGTVIQTGGFNDGETKIRTYKPCPTCDWLELSTDNLAARRWYATNVKLPDNRQIIIGGRRQFNYEFYPKTNTNAKNVYSLPFLVQTNDPHEENNLYPFVFLNVDGNLFIFANNRAILFDYGKNVVVRTFPPVPGGDPRCYPSTGSAVLLPLKNSLEAEVLICGGAPRGAYRSAMVGQFLKALNTCARVKITDPDPKWVVETMPQGRVMSDMVMLPNGMVLIVNGAGLGSAGWEFGRDPVLSPFLYEPESLSGSRFKILNSSTTSRMYHSTAILLRDGKILIAGSNPHVGYNFSNVMFPTDLSMETFSPPYLDLIFDDVRPKIVYPEPHARVRILYDQKMKLQFHVEGSLVKNFVSVTMLAPPLNTHSFSMNQRMLVLEPSNVTNFGGPTYEIEVTTPKSPVLAPPGFYLMFVVHQEIPSEGIWIQIL